MQQPRVDHAPTKHGAPALRRLARATFLAAAAGLVACEAEATPATLFGTAEFRAEALDALPQWQRALARMSAEDEVARGCASDPRRCPSRATTAWGSLLRGLEGETRARQVREVNRFVNQWSYRADIDNYGRSDYWATPFEFFRRSGDCEDYVIAKYRSLRLLGMPADQLRMVVVQDVARDLPHAVLAVYLGPDVLILDNLSDAVLPQGRINHYVPYYSINETARWAHTPTDAVVVTSAVPVGVQPAQN
jgi:predicted transglutaminase-like cysteine proteinase